MDKLMNEIMDELSKRTGVPRDILERKNITKEEQEKYLKIIRNIVNLGEPQLMNLIAKHSFNIHRYSSTYKIIDKNIYLESTKTNVDESLTIIKEWFLNCEIIEDHEIIKVSVIGTPLLNENDEPIIPKSIVLKIMSTPDHKGYATFGDQVPIPRELLKEN